MSGRMDATPAQDGFRMPAEFEPHAGCWMLWPERPDNWRLGAEPAQQAYARVVAAISAFEPVVVGASDRQVETARSLLPRKVRVVALAADDAWMRDVGPTFVVHDGTGRVGGVHWRFNAWGGREQGAYFPWDRDAAVARRVLEMEGVPRYAAPLVLEGGSFHVDGQGTLITTEQCLLNPNRNPGLDRLEIEALLKAYLGVDTVLWLGRGVVQDETDGHVDNLCCFIRPAEVLLTWTDDVSDPQHEISRDAWERLSRGRDARGRSLTVHRIHQPGPLFMTPEESRGVEAGVSARPRRAGDRLAASYANFYIANGGIVMPLFDDPKDGPAAETLTRLFPNRKVVGVQSREILLGGGNIHCITQQRPAPPEPGCPSPTRAAIS